MNATPQNCNGTELKAIAAEYVNRGLVPIPILRRGNHKKPKYDDWNQVQPTPEDLDKLFPEGEQLNIGLLLGEPSGGLIDIDLDCDVAIKAAPYFLPKTEWISGRASRPRSHWWYRVGNPPQKATQKLKDLDGSTLLELRSTGGQTVVPPGIHESGEELVWYQRGDLPIVEIADLRQAVLLIAAVSILAHHWPEVGSRQDAILALSGGLLRAGWSIGQVERFIEALATTTDDEEIRMRINTVKITAKKLQQGEQATGWPSLKKLLTGDGNAIVKTVLKWLNIRSEPNGNNLPAKTANPSSGVSGVMRHAQLKKIEPYKPFPVHCLPKPLDEYVAQGSAALGCDPAYLALPVLSVIGGMIGYTRIIRLKRSWKEPAVIWSLLIGDSGTLKSPAYRMATDPLFNIQIQLNQEYQQALNKYGVEKEAYEEAKREAKKNNGPDPGDPPECPTEKIIFSSDTTIEALAEIIDDNPRGLLIACDELTAWFGMFARYQSGKQGSSDLARWLSMHSAGGFCYHRKTGDRRRIIVPHAAVSVCGGIQPGVLARALTPEFMDAGLAARLLMAMPPKKAKRWTEAEIDEKTEQDYHRLLLDLMHLDFYQSEQKQRPFVHFLTPEAKSRWIEYYNTWGNKQQEVEGELAAAFSKLEGYAARFALLHHVVTHVYSEVDDCCDIGTVSLEAGIALTQWFADEARRIYSSLSESTEERDLRRLIEFIAARGGSITVRQLMRANSRRFPVAEVAEEALGVLVDAGIARWIQAETRMTGGRPIRAIELCMTHDTADTASLLPVVELQKMYDTASDTVEDSCSKAEEENSREIDANHLDEGTYSNCRGNVPQSGVSGVMRHAEVVSEKNATESAMDRCHADLSVSCSSVMHHVTKIDTCDALNQFVGTLWAVDLMAVDIETTGLNPRKNKIRLLSIGIEQDEKIHCHLVDCSMVDPAPLLDVLKQKELILHNAAFDLGFLMQRGFQAEGRIHDTMLLAQLLTAGTNEKVSLAACAKKYLNRPLDKTEQKSDWSGELTDKQLDYAAEDVVILFPLYRQLTQEIEAANLSEVAELESSCLPTMVWMSHHGVPADRDAWLDLAQQSQADADRLLAKLHEMAPTRPEDDNKPWNWDSPKQIKDIFALADCPIDDTRSQTLAKLDHPIARTLLEYRHAKKRSTCFGEDWLKKYVVDDGRIYPKWRQIGADSGRMSCSTPNMQQLPQGPWRSCIKAPEGRVLVKADYSQIELRIAAKISGDQAMQEAYQAGTDLHTRTAQQVLKIDEVSKDQRQLAKALNFGLLFGMGAKGFRSYAEDSYGVKLTEQEAQKYRTEFFRTYSGLAQWQKRIRSLKAKEARTLSGRRRWFDDKSSDMQRYNTPVQGTGADGLKLALASLYEQRAAFPNAYPVLVVHDEIVLECPQEQGEAVAQWLKQIMIDAMAPLLDPVPVEVEMQIGLSWGGE